MLEGEKNNMQAHTPRKKKVLKKKFMTRPNHPTPPPSPPQKSNGRPLIVAINFNLIYYLFVI